MLMAMTSNVSFVHDADLLDITTDIQHVTLAEMCTVVSCMLRPSTTFSNAIYTNKWQNEIDK